MAEYLYQHRQLIFSLTCVTLFECFWYSWSYLIQTAILSILFVLVIRGVPYRSSWTACFGLFKLPTHSTLQIGRGHSTFLGVQTYCNFRHTYSCKNLYSYVHIQYIPVVWTKNMHILHLVLMKDVTTFHQFS